MPSSPSTQNPNPDLRSEASELLVRLCQMIRGPLVQLLESEDAKAQIPGSPLALALRESSYLVKLLGPLQDHFELITGSFSADPQATSIVELIKNLVEDFRTEAEKRQLHLGFLCDLNPDHTVAIFDSGRLAQIVSAFISAAIQTTRQGGVQIKLNQLEEQFQIEIEDTGEGWPVTWHSFLQERDTDFSAEKLLESELPTLNLLVAQALAKALHIELELKTDPKSGTLVRLVLPQLENATDLTSFEDSVIENSNELEREPHSQNFRPGLAARVLVVNDTREDLDSIYKALSSTGARVSLANSGLKAIEIIESSQKNQEPIDAILLDIVMEGMDGREVTQKLRSAGYTLPIIALTDYALRAEREACLEAGCDGFITRPYDLSKMVLMIKAALARRSSELAPVPGT